MSKMFELCEEYQKFLKKLIKKFFKKINNEEASGEKNS